MKPKFKKEKTPKQIAKILVDDNFSIERYTKVQNRRLERLAFWKKINQPVIEAEEQKLVDFGEAVIAEMKILTHQ
jgi:hypothetical protein